MIGSQIHDSVNLSWLSISELRVLKKFWGTSFNPKQFNNVVTKEHRHFVWSYGTLQYRKGQIT